MNSLQPHADTKAKQLAAWKSLVLEYYRITRQAVVDIREVHSSPLFNNSAINRILNKIISKELLRSIHFMEHDYFPYIYYKYLPFNNRKTTIRSSTYNIRGVK